MEVSKTLSEDRYIKDIFFRETMSLYGGSGDRYLKSKSQYQVGGFKYWIQD